MLSKAQISLITSLQHKKFRKQHGLFIVEGIKSVQEFITSSYQVQTIYATAEALTKMGNLPQNLKCIDVSERDFSKITGLTSPQGVLALVQIPDNNQIDEASLKKQHCLVLDDVQDPGNLGTIIRTAEWFGISEIICSIGTVDAYNPKVVQATMGSLSRVRIYYTELIPFVESMEMPTFGALLDGSSIYDTDFGEAGLIIMGNEGNGISQALQAKIDSAVTIPRLGHAESLNVAVATTVFCAELARRKLILK
ncbi:RNA methyltransferase [Sphingobacterium psychroaquaticum]|uniref:TrmH family RNA methyltransferase n=1 Tax=Sphingobacterium psychroaquaticum TaxID=561061 RepID=UPI001069658A|nr:RNA methyltransferase [Sphingobacterium psychroaquaticum]QBQ40336.1 RNA methyltransferase [Sphingobacterium psychroaquaticum]